MDVNGAADVNRLVFFQPAVLHCVSVWDTGGRVVEVNRPSVTVIGIVPNEQGVPAAARHQLGWGPQSPTYSSAAPSALSALQRGALCCAGTRTALSD